ncbi:MAG: hypothetical protein ABI601_05105 [bacterium]
MPRRRCVAQRALWRRVADAERRRANFAAAIYADNTTGATSAYSNASWDFRSVYGGLNYGPGAGYPLVPVNPTSGVASSPTLALGGGASYLRMGVAASIFAPVAITKAGVAPS